MTISFLSLVTRIDSHFLITPTLCRPVDVARLVPIGWHVFLQEKKIDESRFVQSLWPAQFVGVGRYSCARAQADGSCDWRKGLWREFSRHADYSGQVSVQAALSVCSRKRSGGHHLAQRPGGLAFQCWRPGISVCRKWRVCRGGGGGGRPSHPDSARHGLCSGFGISYDVWNLSPCA